MTKRTFLLAALLWGCGGADLGEDTAFATEPQTNWKRDIESTALAVDLQSRKATAVIEVGPSTRRGASFEIGDLVIDRVDGPDGPLAHRLVDGRLDVALKAHQPATITVGYRFSLHHELKGATSSGATFLWPYFCGNLFPCKSDPSDGLRMSLALEGVPEGKTAIFPSVIPGDAPSYMLAWSVGDYTTVELGQTSRGRAVSVSYLPGEKTKALKGTKNLVAIFDWLESTYGEYSFGDRVGSVSASWGPGAFGGMEHHPLWHVSSDSMGDEETHAHEAAHGWFGDGVRIACWEDLTLSEGTTSYVAARAIEAVAGPEAGAAVWADYQAQLDAVIASEDRLARPAGCGGIDVLTDLWNDVPYMKGAFFYRAVEQAVGREALDRALATFYRDHVGQAAGVDDMLDTIERETGFDPTELASGWLRSLGRPDK